MTNQRCRVLLCIISIIACMAPLNGAQENQASQIKLVAGGFAAGALTVIVLQKLFKKDKEDRRLELQSEMLAILNDSEIKVALEKVYDTNARKIVDERLLDYDAKRESALARAACSNAKPKKECKEGKQRALTHASDGSTDGPSSSDGITKHLQIARSVVPGSQEAYGDLTLAVVGSEGRLDPVLGPWPQRCYPESEPVASSSNAFSVGQNP